MWGTHPLASETGVRGRRATIWWIVRPYAWLALPTFTLWQLLRLRGFASQPVGWIGSIDAGTVVVVILACTQGLVLWRMMKVRRELRSGNGCYCLHCGHSLVGLESLGRCPECGRSYEIRMVSSAWRSVAGAYGGEPGRPKKRHEH